MPSKSNGEFHPKRFPATIGEGRIVVAVPKEQTIFAQGDPADAIFYIQKGKVRLTVVSQSGKETTLGILSEEQFFGEGTLAGQRLRLGSAIALADCELLRIDKKAMMLALRERRFSDVFVAYLLARNIRYEEGSHFALASTFGKEGAPETVIHSISQETIAERVGTTRPRVNLS